MILDKVRKLKSGNFCSGRRIWREFAG